MYKWIVGKILGLVGQLLKSSQPKFYPTILFLFGTIQSQRTQIFCGEVKFNIIATWAYFEKSEKWSSTVWGSGVILHWKKNGHSEKFSRQKGRRKTISQGFCVSFQCRRSRITNDCSTSIVSKWSLLTAAI